jgi:hypothetical protein
MMEAVKELFARLSVEALHTSLSNDMYCGRRLANGGAEPGLRHLRTIRC